MACDNDNSAKSTGDDMCNNLKGRLGCGLEMDKETVEHCEMFAIELLPQCKLGDVLQSEGGVSEQRASMMRWRHRSCF